MTANRITRINELLRREIAEALYHIIHDEHFDLSAVTVTHVVTNRDLRNARVFISIRNHKDQRENMLRVLRRHRSKIQRRVGRNLVLKYTPRLSFELDTSVEKGDKLLSLLAKMEGEEDREQRTDDPPAPDLPALLRKEQAGQSGGRAGRGRRAEDRNGREL